MYQISENKHRWYPFIYALLCGKYRESEGWQIDCWVTKSFSDYLPEFQCTRTSNGRKEVIIVCLEDSLEVSEERFFEVNNYIDKQAKKGIIIKAKAVFIPPKIITDGFPQFEILPVCRLHQQKVRGSTSALGDYTTNTAFIN